MKWKKPSLAIDFCDAAILIAPLILFSPVLGGGKALFWGTTILQFIPWRHIAVEILRQGQIPLWNPYSGMGSPLLANYQSALVYPLNWIMMLLDYLGGAEWSAVGQGYFIVVHLALAGLGIRRFLKLMGVNELGQLVGGVGYALGGYLVSRVSFQSIILSAAWIPWILYFLTKSINNPSNKKVFVCLCISLTFQVLAGHAQTTWYTVWLGFAWALYLILQRSKLSNQISLNTFFKCFIPWVSAILVAGLLSSIQILPTLEYLLNSQRAGGVNSEIGLTYSFWPWRFLTILMPNLFGSPGFGNYWGYANYWEDAIYSGSAALPLAIYALFIWIGNQRKGKESKSESPHQPNGIGFWWVMVVISLLLALGKNLPYYEWFYNHSSLLRLFQAPTRISIIAQFGLAFLAGAGIDLWTKPLGKRLYWLHLSIAGGFAMAVTALIFYSFTQDFFPTIVLSVMIFGFQSSVFGIILLKIPNYQENINNSKKLNLWGLFVTAFFMIDLLGMQWGLNPGINPKIYAPQNSEVLGFQLDSGRGILMPEDEYQLKFKDYLRFDTFHPPLGWEGFRFTWLPNMNLLEPVSMVNNFDPFVPKFFADWMAAIEDSEKRNDSSRLRKLIELSSVNWIVERGAAGEVVISPFSGSEQVWFSSCSILVNDEDAVIEQILAPNFDTRKVVVLNSNGLMPQNDCGNKKTNAEVSIQTLIETPNQIVFAVNSDTSGWLVLNDTHYPGWVAEVNGKRTKLYTANVLFRAVPLQPGESEIKFTYRPKSFYIGMILSSVTFVIFLIYALLKIYNAHSK